MAYPFANNQYAQSASHSHSYDNDYNRSYAHPAAHPDQYASTSAPYEQERQYADYNEPPSNNRDSYYEPVETITPIAPYGKGQEQDLHPSPTQHEKELVSGTTPYEKSTDLLTASPYRGNSIWTTDHRRVMGKRSVPVRILRVSFCVIINTIIVILSIVSLVIIFARPPMIGIGNINPPTSSSVRVNSGTLTLNGSVDFVFSNPNSISFTLTSLNADIFDKVDTAQAIGSGTIRDAKIPPHSNTTITFPYQVKYNPQQDPNRTILRDLSAKCGGNGGSSQDLDLTLKINARITILGVPIPIDFKQDISFTCPISSDILQTLGVSGLSGQLKRAAAKLIDKRWKDLLSDRREL